jgi:hypothetical protein
MKLRRFIPIAIGVLWLGASFTALIRADYAKTAAGHDILIALAVVGFVSFAGVCIAGFAGVFNKKK